MEESKTPITAYDLSIGPWRPLLAFDLPLSTYTCVFDT